MKNLFKISIFILLLCIFSSCASTQHASKYESQKRGLLMLEGEDIYKNKGFYKNSNTYQKQHQKNLKKLKKNRKKSKLRFK